MVKPIQLHRLVFLKIWSTNHLHQNRLQFKRNILGPTLDLLNPIFSGGSIPDDCRPTKGQDHCHKLKTKLSSSIFSIQEMFCSYVRASNHFKASPRHSPFLPCVFGTMLYTHLTQLNIASAEQFQNLHLFLHTATELTQRLRHRIAHIWGIVFHLISYN